MKPKNNWKAKRPNLRCMTERFEICASWRTHPTSPACWLVAVRAIAKSTLPIVKHLPHSKPSAATVVMCYLCTTGAVWCLSQDRWYDEQWRLFSATPKSNDLLFRIKLFGSGICEHVVASIWLPLPLHPVLDKVRPWQLYVLILPGGCWFQVMKTVRACCTISGVIDRSSALNHTHQMLGNVPLR